MVNRRRRWLPLAACVALCGAVGGSWLLRAGSAGAQPQVASAGSALRPVAVAEDGYVSSQTCRSCHPGEYATWHASYHRTMTQVVTPDTMLGDFDDVHLDYHGVEYHLIHDGDIFFFIATERRPDGEVVQFRRPILLSTGSHHLQAYWYPTGTGRAMEFFPFIWVIQEGRWMPRESVFLQPTVPTHVPLDTKSEQETWQFDRRWNHSCLHCHTTRPRPNFPEIDTTVAEFGIACEACHGPAAEHVALNRDPLRRYQMHLAADDQPDDAAARDPSIVEPSTLTARRSSQVCGSCHSVQVPAEAFQNAMVTTGHPYRPGDELEDTRIICRPAPGQTVIENCSDAPVDYLFWPDGMVRITGREYNGLIESPCFQGESTGEAAPAGHRASFSCVSCHELHPGTEGIQTADGPELRTWSSDQLAAPHVVTATATIADSNQACLSCHGQFAGDAALTAHTHHDAASAGSSCYECHMPHTSYGLLKAVRSHQISSPSAQVSLDTGRPNACNLCHLDSSLTWTADHLTRWYDQPALDAESLDPAWTSAPATTVWLLRGDAAQRALIAAAYGRDTPRRVTRQTVGDDLWLTSYLSQLLIDPYDAVRFIAQRSLRTFGGFEDFDVDVMKRPELRPADADAAFRRWRAVASHRPSAQRERLALAALLWPPAARAPEAERVLEPTLQARLYAERDDRVVRITE